MRRIWAYLLASLLLVCSCVNPLAEPEADENGGAYPEGAKVTINFAVAGDAVTIPTKAGQELGDDDVQPGLQTLHLAVFGSSGYLKEYVEATPTGFTGEVHRFPDPNDPENEEKKISVKLYGFTAKLTLTDSKRIIHFIGNGPETLSFGYADAVLAPRLSSSGERAYWQMMRINGIHAKQSTSAYKDNNGKDVEIGDYIDANGDKVIDGEGYVVADETQAQFKTIPLVRNWAKLIVEADKSIPEGGTTPNNPCFEPISYAVVHVPDRGTIAPHSAATNGFIENYERKTYDDIVQLGYPANLPPGTSFNNDIPPIEAFQYWEDHDPADEPEGFQGWKNGVAPAGSLGAVFLYERPIPSDQIPPTFLIIYGTYKPDDPSNPNYGKNKKCFYKVDLMTDRKYYPIYRNFQYRVLIHSILSLGHATPEAAAAAAGSADVSADINARHLADISDGKRRLAIQPWMAKTFTVAQVGENTNIELSAYFDDDISTEGWDATPGAVTVERLPMKNSAIDNVIESWSIASVPDERGFRAITFTTSGPSDNIRSQTLRVTGTSGEETLYRDIVITIQNVQDMQVSCSDRRIKSEKGTPVDIYIDIPDGLAESMFPLQFLIEPEKMTLSPNHDNLPVEHGTSISGSDKPAFHFIKSLDWDEYQSLPAELDATDKVWRRITCHFISNRDLSTTAIYVKDVDAFFHPADTQLGNFSDKSFFSLHFVEPIEQNKPGQSLTLTFDVARGDDNELPEIELFVDGLIPQSREGLALPEGFTPSSDATYRFTPTTSHVSIPLITTYSHGDVYLRLEAEDYESQSLKTHHFTLFNEIGFFDGHATTVNSGWSNVVYGKVNRDNNKNVLFGYYDDPDALNPTIKLRNLQSLTPQGVTYPWTPSGPRSVNGDYNYHELEFKTNNDNIQKNASFILSAPGYLEVTVDAPRIRGNIFTVNPGLNANTTGMDKDTRTYTVTMDSGAQTKHVSTVTFSENFRIEKSGVWLDPGAGPGTITITNDNPSTFRLFYVQFTVGQGNYNGQKKLFPNMDTVSLPEGEQYFKYPGSNDQFIWLRPDKTDTATITVEATDDYPFVITNLVLKTFRYY